jgi:hypothetical protein
MEWDADNSRRMIFLCPSLPSISFPAFSSNLTKIWHVILVCSYSRLTDSFVPHTILVAIFTSYLTITISSQLPEFLPSSMITGGSIEYS